MSITNIGNSGSVCGILVGHTLCLLMDSSSSSWRLVFDGQSKRFVCMGEDCNCCHCPKYEDLLRHVTELAQKGKALGAKQVLCRNSSLTEIAELPVKDASGYVGKLKGAKVFNCPRTGYIGMLMEIEASTLQSQ